MSEQENRKPAAGAKKPAAKKPVQRPAVRKTAPKQPEHGKLYDVLNAQPKPEEAPQTPVRNVMLRNAVTGMILTVLSCIGIWSLVQQGRNYYQQKRAEDPYQSAMTQCILPLAVMDAHSFASPDDLSDEAFLTAAIWAFITDGGLADYPSETDLCTVPAKTIIAAGNARFGTNRTPTCQTIGFTDSIRFYFDAEQKAYLLPSDPKYFGYLPDITSYTEKDGIYTVHASYRPEQPSWYPSEAPIVRETIYTLTQSGSTWQILSLDTGEPEAESTAEPAETTTATTKKATKN
ncbi:MAG TPA: hypothetical protein DCG49_06245 [Ruminococcus sp.]|nr:hypothetical protein [Ruminococcus sp.]